MILLTLWTVGTRLFLQYPQSAMGDEISRSQRTTSPSSLPDEIGTCSSQCVMELWSNLRKRIGDNEAANLLDLNYNNFLFAMSNVTILHQFCQEFHKFEYCCSSCTPSYSREILMGCSQIIDHICVYNFKEIKEHFGCLARLDPQMRQLCMRTCTPLQEAFYSIARNFRHFILNGDASELENYLNESCEYVVCSLHCDIPSIVHTCSYDTAERVVTLTRNSFATMKKISLDAGVVNRWPQACAEIVAYKIPQRSQAVTPKSSTVQPKQSESNARRNDDMLGLLSLLLLSVVYF